MQSLDEFDFLNTFPCGKLSPMIDDTFWTRREESH